ncbi:MAG: 50S ribosomal protein L18 [Candidatus Sungbacteria bacterium]|uniref:Large ribosomal subunit protein uL18 n=1 Tax=Candidatus Sungiibacteriota bacterium TaxID=2750080 RepID=A0A9D6QTU1_9BACT|nr:50S ribosomal protein L18 [Candidatus Sungbacteria bacterium]
MGLTSSRKRIQQKTRARRTRFKLRAVSRTLPRLSIFRSGKHMYAQIIDDAVGKTIVSAHDAMKRAGGKKKPTPIERATYVGAEIAKKALEKKIKAVVFDRGGYKYHGRIKALADAARKAGLAF